MVVKEQESDVWGPLREREGGGGLGGWARRSKAFLSTGRGKAMTADGDEVDEG